MVSRLVGLGLKLLEHPPRIAAASATERAVLGYLATNCGICHSRGDDMTARWPSLDVRSLIEASIDPLITINKEGKITDVNEAMEKITGLKRERITGTDFFDYFTQPGIARQVYEEVFEKGSIVDYQLTIRHKNGKLIDVLFNGSLYKDQKGNVLGVVVVAREKLLSKYSRTLIEASLDPLITINSEGKITDMNQALVDNPTFDAWVKGRTPSRRWGKPDELIGTVVFCGTVYALGLGAGTQVLTGMVESFVVSQPSPLSTALSIAAGWVINLAIAEWAIRRLPAQRARAASTKASHAKREQPGAA